MSTVKKLYTVKEMQESLQIGRAKAYEIVNMHGAPVYRIGKNIRVDLDEIIEWIKGGQA